MTVSLEIQTSPTDHFARIRPIVGDELTDRRVALIGWPTGADLVHYLAASGVRHWQWLALEPDEAQGLQIALTARHGQALALTANRYNSLEWIFHLDHSQPDLLIVVGVGPEMSTVVTAAIRAAIPILLILPPSKTEGCRTITFFSGDSTDSLETALQTTLTEPTVPIDLWAWQTAAPLCAGLARAILLSQTAFQRPDLADLWASGLRASWFGPPDDPLAVSWSTHLEPRPAVQTFRTPLRPQGQLLIAGLGSLGSVAAMSLVAHAAEFVIADPDQVDAYNPVRQAYPLEAIGQKKAEALQAQLLRAGAQQVTAFAEALTEEKQIAMLIEQQSITAALIATGTTADFTLARVLRRYDIPHIVGRCYPRARYWEALLIDGQRGPALADLRGHLPLGPTPPPTPEQQAAYSDAGALEAEPATLIESGWAAAWLARLTAQFLAPPGLRERWFLERLADETPCLIGGVGVERTATGPAYRIDQPGQIRAWGRANIRVD